MDGIEVSEEAMEEESVEAMAEVLEHVDVEL